jgi:cell division septum initiation protein DivIVA
MRVGLIGQISPVVMDKIFCGKFPVYSYMYTIRTFMRMNGIKKQEVDEFVNCVSGKGLSIRDIEILANGYFKGGEDLRQQIKNGNISWGLNRLKQTSALTTGLSQVERRMLSDLEILQKYMQRVINKSQYDRFKTATFFAQANLLTAGILRQMDIFAKSIKEFHDKSGQTQSDLSAL